MRNILTEKQKLKDKSSRKQGDVAGHHEEVQECELRGKENLEWNTDPIETMKLENVICQATQGLYSDEEQYESREADVPTRGYKRLQEVTRGYKRLQEVTRTQTMASLCQRRPSSRGVSIPRHT